MNRIATAGITLGVLLAPASARATPPPPVAPGAWSALATPCPRSRVTLHANAAPLAGVARDLARQTKARIDVAAGLASSLVTVRIHRQPLEQALSKLAPVVHVDYLYRSETAVDPICEAIHLGAAADAPPQPLVEPENAAIIMGNTEDETVEAPGEPEAAEEEVDEPFVRVTVEAGLVSIRSQHLPLAMVLYEVATKLGAPFRITAATAGEIVDLNVDAARLDQLAGSFPPGVRLWVRKNVGTGELTLQRAEIAEPPGPAPARSPAPKR